jgi:predicted PolB exonuclease-like 3'-5' exonuclease
MEKILFIDYETIPDMTRVNILPEVVAKKNLKDSAKIRADIKEKKEKQLNEMNLTPALNIICCSGWCDLEGNQGHFLLDNEESEKDLLLKTWELYAKYDHFVTFNGRSFDLRCLYLHSMLHNVRPSVNISASRYNKGNHTDLRLILSGDGMFAKGSLEFYAQLFLNKGKTEGINGKDVHNWWIIGDKDYIAEYCEKDCVLTRELYNMSVSSGLLEAMGS